VIDHQPRERVPPRVGVRRTAKSGVVIVNHPHRATIPPLTGAEPRPLWSVMIPTYNCARYLRETLQSVLVQDPGPAHMQIEVVDDGSTEDDPGAVVRDVGHGRVAFYQQASNVGHVRNFETCLLRARGELIHLLHGDDRVRPGFYATLERPFRDHPEIGAAFCRGVFMNERGHWALFSEIERTSPGVIDDWLQTIAAQQKMQTPAVVVRRSVYECLGGFDDRLAWSEDWEMWVRIAANYPVWYEPEVLAEYRMHGSSSTNRNVRTGENIRDTLRAIEIIRTSLREPTSGRVTERARGWCGWLAIDMAKRAVRRRDWRTAAVQLREGWKSSPSLPQAKHSVRFLVWAAAQRLGRWESEEYLSTLGL
jgi:GT2 family glycosyltransferase